MAFIKRFPLISKFQPLKRCTSSAHPRFQQKALPSRPQSRLMDVVVCPYPALILLIPVTPCFEESPFRGIRQDINPYCGGASPALCPGIYGSTDIRFDIVFRSWSLN